MTSIEKQRLKDFKYNSKHISRLHENIDAEFSALNENISCIYGARIILKLFEYMLFNNYIASGENKVVTKCEISVRILSSDSNYKNIALEFLNAIYESRNACAHSKLNSNTLYLKVLNIIADVQEFTLFEDVLKLLLPFKYPMALNNIYYLVPRSVENSEYTQLKRCIFNKLCTENLTVSQVRKDLNLGIIDYIRDQALLDVLANYGLTDEEKQET